MGIQPVGDVDLIRHAYVLPGSQRRGVGAALLAHLRGLTGRRMLVGTWAAAGWAVRFYGRNGFEHVTPEQKTALLRTYWTIPDRQIETSVVLATRRFRADELGDDVSRRQAVADVHRDTVVGQIRGDRLDLEDVLIVAVDLWQPQLGRVRAGGAPSARALDHLAPQRHPPDRLAHHGPHPRSTAGWPPAGRLRAGRPG